MATRRRRPNPRPVETPTEPTHEEMLEVAAEREAEATEEEEHAIEALMSMALADTFEAIYKAEEEKGIEDFFEPTPQVSQVVRVPVVLTPPSAPAPPPAARLKREPRYLIRQNRHPKYNQG